MHHFISHSGRRLKHYAVTLYSKFCALSPFKKVMWGGASITTLCVSGALFLWLLVWSGALGHLPTRAELKQVKHPVATEVYSADSVLLGRYFVQERSNIAFEQLSPYVRKALLATEDVRFYEHHGIDFRSLGRVLVKSLLLQRESSGGGSTITQQLAKNLYPRKDYWFASMPVNKVREMIIAWRLENIYSKDDLMVLYLNTIPFGENTFGIKAASERFFSCAPKQLTAQQAAVLIGMLKATYWYNPRLFPERARVRRDVVLAQMKKYGYLNDDMLDSLQALPLELHYRKITHHTGLAPYFRAYLQDQLEAWCETHYKPDGELYNLYTDGLKIYTTLRAPLQRYAEAPV